jgi:hypothetical protein
MNPQFVWHKFYQPDNHLQPTTLRFGRGGHKILGSSVNPMSGPSIFSKQYCNKYTDKLHVREPTNSASNQNIHSPLAEGA